MEQKVLKQKSNLMAIAVVIVFAVASFFLTRPAEQTQGVSAVSGLMSLQTAAKEAMPYETAIANQKPTLIEFYADWCTTCQAFAPTLQAVHQDVGNRVNFVMLDIDNPRWQTQVRQFRVNGVPYLVLLDQHQAIADTFIGKVPKTILYDRLVDLLG